MSQLVVLNAKASSVAAVVMKNAAQTATLSSQVLMLCPLGAKHQDVKEVEEA
jgi:hypothetical protein